MLAWSSKQPSNQVKKKQPNNKKKKTTKQHNLLCNQFTLAHMHACLLCTPYLHHHKDITLQCVCNVYAMCMQYANIGDNIGDYTVVTVVTIVTHSQRYTLRYVYTM